MPAALGLQGIKVPTQVSLVVGYVREAVLVVCSLEIVCVTLVLAVLLAGQGKRVKGESNGKGTAKGQGVGNKGVDRGRRVDIEGGWFRWRKRDIRGRDGYWGHRTGRAR
jgi:hypothetical protein